MVSQMRQAGGSTRKHNKKEGDINLAAVIPSQGPLTLPSLLVVVSIEINSSNKDTRRNLAFDHKSKERRNNNVSLLF